LRDEARATGYGRMLLATGDWLVPALALYRALGFTEVPAYYYNPVSGTVYLAGFMTLTPSPDAESPAMRRCGAR
jgi:hypothetical protein